MKEQKRQRLVIAAILAALTVCAAGCSSNPEESTADKHATTTAAASSAAEETTATTTTAAVSSEEPEVSMADNGTVSEFKTQYDLIAYVNKQFGLDVYGTNTEEENLKQAKNFEIIDDSFDKDAPVTAEFLVTTLIKACESDLGQASFDQQIDIAVESGIIDDKDLSKLDLSNSTAIVDRAADIWSYSKYDFHKKSKELKGGKTDTDTSEAKDKTDDSSKADDISKADEPSISISTDATATGFATQYDLLAYINLKFGIDYKGTNSVEENIQSGKNWDIIDDDFDKDAPVTAEALVNMVARAGFYSASETPSLKESTKKLFEKRIIDNANIEKIDLSKASEIVDKAAFVWINSAFDDSYVFDIDDYNEYLEGQSILGKSDKPDTNTDVTDDVLDLTGRISSGEIEYDDPFIYIPNDIADTLELDQIVKLPADSKGNGGGTYKINAIGKINDQANIQGKLVD